MIPDFYFHSQKISKRTRHVKEKDSNLFLTSRILLEAWEGFFVGYIVIKYFPLISEGLFGMCCSSFKITRNEYLGSILTWIRIPLVTPENCFVTVAGHTIVNWLLGATTIQQPARIVYSTIQSFVYRKATHTPEALANYYHFCKLCISAINPQIINHGSSGGKAW